MISMAVADAGTTYAVEWAFAPFVARGDLELVPSDWTVSGPGYQLFYFSRRQLPIGLKLLIDRLRELRPSTCDTALRPAHRSMDLHGPKRDRPEVLSRRCATTRTAPLCEDTP